MNDEIIENNEPVIIGRFEKPIASQNEIMTFFKRMDRKKDYSNVYSAGILPFNLKGKNIYFLLGKDPDGKWSDFGGRSEIGDNSRWDLTAAREFYEETIGSVMDIQTVTHKLQNKKNCLKLKDKTLNGYPYYMYVLRTPQKDIYRHNFRSTFLFMKYTNNCSMTNSGQNNSKFDYKYLEKIDIQWVSLDFIKESLTNDNTEYPLRSVFKRTLENNLEKIEEFCKCYVFDTFDTFDTFDKKNEMF
jgi:hypothetical protein